MNDLSAEPVVPQSDIEARRKQRRTLPWGQVLSFVVGLVGIAALGATGWVYAETQREIVRISTDIAQIRLSLELYGRQQAGGTAEAGSSTVLDLSNRLAILEESWRGGTPATGSATLPAVSGTPAGATSAAGPSDDCLPSGTRILVSAGDRYPVCGQSAVIEVAAVDNGYIALIDGTTVAAGGTIALVGTTCMLGVMSSGDEGMTGFAEIRVSC